LAQQWTEAQLRADDLAAELAAAHDKVAATTAQYAQIEASLSQIAINRFTGASVTTILVIFGNPVDELQMNVLRSVALDQGAGDLDQVDLVRSNLDAQRQHVAALQIANDQAAKSLTSSKTKVEEQLAQLVTLHARLQDQEVKLAYEAQLAKQRQELAAQQQAQAAAQAAAALTAAAAAAPVRGGGTQPDLRSSAVASSQPAQAPTTSANASASSPPVAPAATPVVAARSGWICPVKGPTAFGDTFGAARPGGRRHEGVDMISPAGTPLVAVVAGNATMHGTSLGGNSVSLAGDDGTDYFYAHLSAYAGGSRHVGAGEVIGYVGATGDTSVNHLHFEIHPGRGVAVDPYPTVRQYC
jgi:murein DD-endopeptidase MepM/ murein hydrolase activator NlpD